MKQQQYSKQVYSKQVITWLFIGLVMVFIQVLVGGITRLTESGLSITKWEVISGTFPPVSDAAWELEFEKYKQTPQYVEINEGMSISDFKFIYFWEYIHRFWARIMGFVFLVPFIYFIRKKMIDRALLKKLGLVILLSILAATFGWMMVASGLIERPWVNAYKLSLHLMIAFAVFSALWWTYLYARDVRVDFALLDLGSLRNYLYVLGVVLVFQIFLGGVMSGMKAAVVYPSWPDMNGAYLPSIIFDFNQWSADNFNQYDRNEFMPALIHFLHRSTAYLLVILGLIFSIKLWKIAENLDNKMLRNTSLSFAVILMIQVLLGIITVVSSVGQIPVLCGVLHQAFA
ncbi:MAG: COX15/CtaA family protein, partial [Saprospiraceae bacterium]